MWKHIDMVLSNNEYLESMFAINQDPKFMEYFPSIQDLEMTKNFIDKVNAQFENHGYSPYATLRKDMNIFIGLSGMVDAVLSKISSLIMMNVALLSNLELAK